MGPATLAKSAGAYKAGTLNPSREAGVAFMQVFDGADCGWTSHQDPDKAQEQCGRSRRRRPG